MFRFRQFIARGPALAIFIALCGAASADTVSLTNGKDTFISGDQINHTVDTGGDTFLVARRLRAGGTAGGDLHVAGFDVSVSTDVAQDLYAAGATVEIGSAIDGDLTAAGFSIKSGKTSQTGGNARLTGHSVTVEGPVEGALSTMGRDVILNAAISGDVRIVAQTLAFGPDAVVSGTLTYSTAEKMAVPDRVAPAERVVFEPLSAGHFRKGWDEMGEDMPVLPTFASIMFSFVISLLFFVAVGALMLGFMPKRLARMRRSIAEAPGQTFLLGIIGLSMLFGMVPITALTLIGLPFVPIVVLSIVVAWTLGYALGAYGVAMRLWSGFGGSDDPGMAKRLLVFAAAITFIALLNFIPFVGWVANYTLVLLGLGAMTRALFQWMIGNPDIAFDVDMKPVDN